jgi:hypothetical protein
MALDGQRAIAGARHRPKPTRLPRHALGEKDSCEGAQRAGSAQGTAPRGLRGSDAVIGCFSRQPEALTGHPQRAHPARLAAESAPKALTSRRWPAVMTPRNGGLRAADAVASHRAVDGAGPSVEGARTHAGGISRGAVVRFPAFWTANPAPPANSGVADSPTSDPRKEIIDVPDRT